MAGLVSHARLSEGMWSYTDLLCCRVPHAGGLSGDEDRLVSNSAGNLPLKRGSVSMGECVYGVCDWSKKDGKAVVLGKTRRGCGAEGLRSRIS